MTDWELFKSYMEYVINWCDSYLTWSDDDKLDTSILIIKKEIERLERGRQNELQ